MSWMTEPANIAAAYANGSECPEERPCTGCGEPDEHTDWCPQRLRIQAQLGDDLAQRRANQGEAA